MDLQELFISLWCFANSQHWLAWRHFESDNTAEHHKTPDWQGWGLAAGGA